ncbi:D-tyrosyl-tRNA(Tyr) deacylase [Candidatus Woesebacteria bacterium]|nr:D-tyrosyl-tRNA(Tyr) deacylase [Candidatus Woesebacteria bacterium]
MKALIQRVARGSVKIDDKPHAQIGRGYVIFLGVCEEDTKKDVTKLVDKIVNLRIMSDEYGKMNCSILETKGEILLVSQFTLCADCKKGRRPSFIHAMKPEKSKRLYEYMGQELAKTEVRVQTGVFGAMMDVEIINDGPVTILLDSQTL